MRSYELTPLKPTTSDIRIIAFDTEDNGQGAPDNFLCATFYSENEQKTFLDRDEAREYMFKERNGSTIFFAHNLAYDLANLDYPEGTVKQIVSNSKLIGGLLKKNKKVIRFMDTGNFFVGSSIKSLGKIFGDFKLEFDVNRIKNKKITDLDIETINEMTHYCMKDSEICFMTANKLLKLCNNHQTKFKAFTAGSLSLRMFRTLHLKENWPKRMQHINDYERLAYYGGRTEVFDYTKHSQVFYEDINSSYPTAMFYKTFPKPWTYSFQKDLDWEDIKNFPGVSLVTVEVPYMRISPLPYKEVNGKLIFPYGTWSGVYTHPELLMAEKYGVKIKVHQSIIYGETFSPFKEYIEEFHKLKSSTTGIEKNFYKMLMNSLSGKLGEKRVNCFRVKEEDFKICYCNETDSTNDKCKVCEGYKIGDKEITPNANGWVNIKLNRLPDPIHSFPVLIAYITAYGRIKLFEDRLKYQDAIYCDTDSCISEKDVDINRGSHLGEWDCKTYKNFIAYAPKFYTMDGAKFELKLKGVPKNHFFYYVCDNGHTVYSKECHGVCVEDHNGINKCIECGISLIDKNKFYKYQKPMKLSEAIHRNKKPNEWSEVNKTVSMLDSKRVKLPNGDSKPLHLVSPPITSFLELNKLYNT